MNSFLTRWLSDSSNPTHVPARARKLSVENLEDRTVPAITIPDVPVATGPVQVGNVSNIATNSYDPQTVLNPTNPNQVVTVFTQVSFDSAGNPIGTGLGISTSTNRGQTWTNQGVAVNTLVDPLDFNGANFRPFTDIDTPSVAFDRAGNIYVAYIQRNAGNTVGALVLDKFFVDGFGGVTNLNQQQVLYRYANQDPIFNPVVGVNNLLPTFTDPENNQVNTNFGAGRGVYVAWNTSATQTGFAADLNRAISPSVIQMVVSDDGGASFSSPQFVSDNGFQVGDPAIVRRASVKPQIYFTHNSVTNAIQGGLLGVSWLGGAYRVSAGAVTGVNTLRTDTSDPLNGNAANPLTVQVTTPNFQTGTAPAIGDKPAINTTTGRIADAGTPTGGVLTPRTTTFTQAVTVNATDFTTLADMNVTLSVFSQDLSQMRITLTSPTGVTITLLNARQQLDGAGSLQTITYGDGTSAGVPGGAVAGLGQQVYNIGNNQYFRTGQLGGNNRTGLVFDQQAARRMNDPANAAPYILNLRPEDFTGGLDRFNGLTATQLSGNWTLSITNHRQNDTSTPPITPPNLDQWRMTFVSRVDTTDYSNDFTPVDFFGDPLIVAAPTTANNVGAATAASPTTGIQGWYSQAVDNTNGAFSEFQGRQYVVYTRTAGAADANGDPILDANGNPTAANISDTDIFLSFSDDGINWSPPTRVNDDFGSNDFSEDNRAQFQPMVTVDQATGTVVVMWYDARWDASNARVATFMATSVDGGETFSPNTYLNFTKSALDANDRTLVKIEPLPNNLTTFNTRGNGFGNGQGLVAFDGTIVPVWSGNSNTPNAAFDSASFIRTAVVRTAAGPRVLQGDMGPVFDEFTSPGLSATTYNDTVSIDGTRQLNAFYVRFDRRIDPTTFTPADVQLRYRDTLGSLPVDISNQVLSVVALDPTVHGATRFLVRITPQTAVGTYSYSVGQDISDRIRMPAFGATPAATGNLMDQNGNGTAGESPTVITTFSSAGTVTVPSGSPTTPTVNTQFVDVVGLPTGATNNTTYDVNVRVTLTGSVGGLTTIRLIGPGGAAVVLYDRNVTGSANQLFAATLFDDQSTNSLAAALPNTAIGSIRPVGLLATVRGLSNGTWLLEVTNREAAPIVIQNFQLDFAPNLSDAFANPAPNGGVPFTLPYTVDSLPLIIPGPRVATVSPGLTSDGTASFLDVVFDRDMRSSSFTPAQILELRTPQGVSIVNNTNDPQFTVIPNPPGTDPRLALRTFRVTFPPQVLSGYYSLLLGPGILSATGLAMDPNMNAGVELVTGRVVNPKVGTTVSVDINTGLIGGGTGINIPVATDANTPSVATASISVADAFFLTQQLSTPIQVRLSINTPDTRNLSAQLIAPDGTIIQLFTNPGRSLPPFANFTNTVLNDFSVANSLIQTQGAPFEGVFLPQQQLSVLNGKLSTGTWTLRVFNRSTTQTANIRSWGLSLPKPVLSGGLGELVSDNSTLGFKVFTASPNQTIATTHWTPLGPTLNTDFGTGEQSNGVITVTAVDPSDPSGNTVYAGSARGGLWKTSNFLTFDPTGPTWIPLLDAASARAMRISSIAIIPRSSDPTQQSIVLVGTGEPETGAGGVGFLRSTDGGRTFRLIDSTVNADAQGNILPVDSNARDHLFARNNSYVNKVVVDQIRQVNGEFYMYAAVGGDAAVAGLWRSVDTGRTWVRQLVGEATDFVLASNRVDIDPATGNPAFRNADIAYVAFATSTIPGAVAGGVYVTQNIIGTTPVLFNQAVGAAGKPLFSNGIFTFAVGNSNTNPNQAPVRILLATVNPPAANDPNGIRVYQGWLYALVIGGTAPGLYQTKDFGANWVLLQTQVSTVVNADGELVQTGVLTNDETEPLFDLGSTVPTDRPRWNSLVVDPTNPNVVYVGATNVLTSANGTEFTNLNQFNTRYSDGGVFRIDASTVNDAHTQVGRDNSAGGVGGQVEGASTGGLIVGPSRIVINPFTGLPENNSAYFNRIRDPNNPFVTGATQIIPVFNGNAPPQFTNNGNNVQVSRFRGVSGDSLIRGLETIFDPLTRKTRLLVSTDRGVFTAVDGADPLPTQGIYENAVVAGNIGSAVVVTGNRSSNLALADVTSTGIQPSGLAGDLAGLYNRVLRDFFGNPLPPEEQNSRAGEYIYTVTDQGYLSGPAGILNPAGGTYGEDRWRGEITTDAYLFYQGQIPTGGQWRYSGQVETDPQGSGTVYQYRPVPYALTGGGAEVDAIGNSTDIFFVTIPGQAPIGRSNGLFNVGLGNTATEGIWATTRTAVFSVNQGDQQGIVIGAPLTGPLTVGGPNAGHVYLSTDQGLNWFNINGSLQTFNASPSSALAFGGQESGRGVNDFIYNGTAEGRIWVTRNAGGTWTEISAGIPANSGPILDIIPNPRQNTFEAYAITARGVFYKADARTTAAWVNVTGNLLTITRRVFGEVTRDPFLTQVTSLAVDWRYTTPTLYIGGDSGVFRATTGTRAANPRWALFPAIADGSSAEGGLLPTARVTDLDLVYGNLNPTGVPDQATARNVLVASTYGRGLFSIRLNPSTIPPDLNTSGPWVNTASLTTPAAATGAASFTVNFGDTTDPVRVDAATLNTNTMAIVGPGGVSVPFTVTDISDPVPGSVSGESLANTFRIDFTPPITGAYQLLMNVGVRDVSGRNLNQNRDGVNGQEPQDYFIGNYTITVNQAPTITSLPNLGLLVGTPSAAQSFTVGDAETAAGSLAIVALSSNPAAVPVGNIVFGGSGANRTVTITGAATGSSAITLRVTDGGGRQTTTSFTVSVATAPTLPFADPFTRGDSPDLGGQWVLETGTAAVASASGLGTSPLAVGTINGITQLNSVSQATVTVFDTGNSSSALIARYSGPGDNNMYIGGLVVANGVLTANIVRFVNGTATVIAQSAVLPPLSEYVIRFEVINDSLKLFVNGQLAAFAFDTAITTAGKTGFRVTQANRFDSFSADNIALTPVTLPAVPGQTATETFTAATGTQLNRNWQDRTGNLSITNAVVVGQGLLVGGAAANLSTLNIPTTTANAGAQVDVGLTEANQYAGVVLRYSGTAATPVSNMYWGGLFNLGNGTQLALIQVNVNGVWTVLASATLGFTGGMVRFEANGPSLKLFVNDTRVLSAFNTQLTAGVAGLLTSQNSLVDNFFAFALGTTATLPASDAFPASAPLNQLGSQWVEQSGAYSVASGAATALASSLTTGTGNTAVLSGVSAADVTVAATVGAQVGGLLSTGLVARYTGTGDVGGTASFYWGTLNVFDPQPFTQYSAQIWKVVNGVPTFLNFNANPILPANAVGKELRLEVVGSTLKLFLDNQIVVVAFDTSITGPGSVGLRTDAGAVLDNFTAVVKPAVNATLPYSDGFASGLNAQNSLPATWQERAGVFSVASNRAIALDPSQPNVAVLNGLSGSTNVSVTADLFFSGANQAAGVVARYQGAGGLGDRNLYYAELVTQANGDALVRLGRDVNGTKTIIVQTTVVNYFPGANFAPSVAPRLRLRANGNQLTVFLDNFVTPLLSATDSTFASGSVGIRTAFGAGVDNFDATAP